MRIPVNVLWFMLSVMFFSMALLDFQSSAHTYTVQIAEGETFCKEVINTGSYCTASTCPSITITFPGLELTGYLGSNYNDMTQRINGSEISHKSPSIFFNVSDWQITGNPCVELWEGVFCNLTSRIIHISLPEVALTGCLDFQLTEFHYAQNNWRYEVGEGVFCCMVCFIAGCFARNLRTNHAGVAIQVADVVNVDGGGGMADDDAAAVVAADDVAAADDVVAAADDGGADDDSDDSADGQVGGRHARWQMIPNHYIELSDMKNYKKAALFFAKEADIDPGELTVVINTANGILNDTWDWCYRLSAQENMILKN